MNRYFSQSGPPDMVRRKPAVADGMKMPFHA
jgi:hypothetical protein